MQKPNPVIIYTLLAALVVFDVGLAMAGYFFPDYWFAVLHGADYVDPQGYLPRSAGNWTMFALLQAIAFVQWRQYPVWLAMIAAVRFSDSLTDWSVLVYSTSVTALGAFSLGSAGVGNIALGIFFMIAWRQATSPPPGRCRVT